jgi:DNA-binding MarR family transcriptional regulator
MDSRNSFDIDDFIQNLHLFTYLTRHNMEGRFVQFATEKQVSFVQMNLMRVLQQHPGQNVGDVARFMNVSYPAATKTIDKLVRLGFVKRREDSLDRRIAHLHLTPSGKKAVEKYLQHKSEMVRKVLGVYGEEKARQLSAHLFDFSRAVVDVIPIRGGVCMQCGAFDPAHCHAAEPEKSCGVLDKQEAAS